MADGLTFRPMENQTPTVSNLAILGLGNQGKHHLAAALKLLKSRKIKRLFLCDNDIARLALYANLENVTIETDASLLIRSGLCQVFIVAVPNSLHEELTLEILKRGGHVLKEKPLALSLDSAQRMDVTARNNGAYLEVVQQRFFHPGFIELTDAMQRIGKVRFVDYHFSLSDDTFSWYWSKRTGGGAWLGIGWHICHVLCSLLGTPHEVRARFFSGKEKRWHYDTEDTVMGEIQFGTVVARFSASVVGMGKSECVLLEGTAGSLSFDRKRLRLSEEMKQVLESDFDAFDWSLAYCAQLEDFLSRVSAGEVGVNALALMTMSILEAGRRSAESDGDAVQVVGWSPEPKYLHVCANGAEF
jgi:predicted dehydrogenase